jgi:ribosomal protein S5
VKATLKALDEMRSPAIVAHYRGVTVDKVFNG